MWLLIMTLDNQLWLVYVVAELAAVSLLIYRRAHKLVPIFLLYCGWDLLSNLASYLVHFYFPRKYLDYYIAQTAIDSVLQFCVLVELSWSVLRPIRQSLPRHSVLAIAGAVLALGAAIWPFASVHLRGIAPQELFLLHLLQTVSLLRVLFFLGLAGGSQLLSLSWRDRELQVITGLGIYSIVSLAVTMYHTHQTSAALNATLNQFVIGSYICSLVYWIICFSQREAERQEFTPQMQNLLLAVAGVARADREALAQRTVTSTQSRRDS